VAVVSPTVTAFSVAAYSQQLQRIGFSKRLHIDLMDGVFAPTTSPDVSDIWLPPAHINDIHLMYQEPMEALDTLILLKPHLVIIHNEAHVHHMHFASELHKHGIKVGLALLHDTPTQYAHQIMHSFDHVLIFSGKLGHHGGQADMSLLNKVKEIRQHHPEVEIGWDGGVNEENITELVKAGVDVLNVGGYIQNASNPEAAYATLVAKVKQR
jgi:ribulose-phosphate 3-epimerase